MGNEDNGSKVERPESVQRVSVSYDPFKRKCDLDLGGLALDDALSLLERAHRELDARYRCGRARELAADQLRALAEQQLVQDLMRKGSGRV